MTTKVTADGVTVGTEIDDDLWRLWSAVSPDNQRSLVPLGTERVVSIYRAATGAVCVVFERRYGHESEQGIRTVVLEEHVNGGEYKVIADAFAPGVRRPSSGTGVRHVSIFTPDKGRPAAPKSVTVSPAKPVDNGHDDRPTPVRPAERVVVNGRPVWSNGDRLRSGFYLEFPRPRQQPGLVGPFDKLADIDEWLEYRYAVTGHRGLCRHESITSR